MAEDQEVARVEDYFAKVGVVALEVTDGEIRIGDRLRYHGHTTDFIETVSSMEVDHKRVEVAKKGDHVGIKVGGRVRRHDKVFKVLG